MTIGQKHCIIYCSPAGSTNHVAEVIESELRHLGNHVDVHHLWQNKGQEKRISQILAQKDIKCFWVGSPVYAFHPIMPVQRFLDSLYCFEHEVFTVPFVTWGGVTSGVALYEMGRKLISKGFSILGAAKILSLHSSMWNVSKPFGQGHPDTQDDAQIKELVDQVFEKMNNPQSTKAIDLEKLDYQVDWVRDQAKEISIEKVKAMHPGFQLDQDSCNQCGICVENCPVGAISLTPYPEIGDDCILCNNCVKTCPEGAFSVDISGTVERIQAMAEKINERPQTQIFI